MSITKVVCPHCQATLRSPKPLAEGQPLRCSGCGERFEARSTAFTATPPAALPDDEDAPSMPLSRKLMPFVIAVCAIFFLVGGGIAVVVWMGQRPAPSAAVDPDRQRQLEEDERKLSVQKKELEEQMARLALETRKAQFERLMIAGDSALAKKQYSEAQSNFYEALKLFPDDPKAKAGLKAAQSGGDVASQLGEDKEKRQAEYNRLMADGKDKMTAKQYAAAVRAFEGALLVMAGDRTASQSLLEAKEALAKNDEETKKLEKYKEHMAAAGMAMLAQRYAEAAKEYRAALLVLPGDAAALQGRRDADLQLNAAADADNKMQSVQQELDKARAALQARRYNLAVKVLEAVVKAAPDVPEASKMLKEAKKAKAQAQMDCARFVNQGNLALQAGRIEEAITNFRQAVKIMPDDDSATKGLQTAEKTYTDLQAGQAAYNRYMGQGQVAMDNNQYVDAAAAYSEALRLFPNDVRAQTGYNLATKAVKVAADRQKKYARLVNVATNALKQRQWPTAIQAANDALLLNPDDATMPTVLSQARYGKAMDDGKFALQQKNYAVAINSFQYALQQKPNDAAANSLLALAKGMR